MDIWYGLVDLLLPFDWTQHVFMKNALLAILLVTPAFGMLGTMVVSNNMAFFSDSIGHSALTGIAAGVLAGIGSPLWSMVLFAILLSIVIALIRNANTASMDTVIGVVSATSVALGVVILSHGGGFSKYSSYLVGDLLSIMPSEILLLALVLAGVVLFWIFFYNKLLVVSINRSLARSRGIPLKLLETAFMITVAVIVTISIRWVGILIINSLLVLPAASARNIAGRVRPYHAVSVAVAVISGVAGLILSYYWGTATGATIVLICSVFFAATFALKALLNR